MRTTSRKVSKEQKVLNYLNRYGSITRITALTHCKVWNLGTVVYKLRKQGLDVRCEGRNENLKYVLYNKQTNQPEFTKFLATV